MLLTKYIQKKSNHKNIYNQLSWCTGSEMQSDMNMIAIFNLTHPFQYKYSHPSQCSWRHKRHQITGVHIST